MSERRPANVVLAWYLSLAKKSARNHMPLLPSPPSQVPYRGHVPSPRCVRCVRACVCAWWRGRGLALARCPLSRMKADGGGGGGGGVVALVPGPFDLCTWIGGAISQEAKSSSRPFAFRCCIWVLRLSARSLALSLSLPGRAGSQRYHRHINNFIQPSNFHRSLLIPPISSEYFCSPPGASRSL
jgi:hypothetical protein